MTEFGKTPNRRSLAAFERWVSGETPKGSNESLEDAIKRIKSEEGRSDQEASNKFAQLIVQKVQGGATVAALLLSYRSQPLVRFGIDLATARAPAKTSEVEYVHFGSITVGDVKSTILRHARIAKLSVGQHRSGRELKCKGCWIKRLEVANGASVDIELTDCWIGELRLHGEKCIERLNVNGGTIRSVVCGAPGEANPFSGSVTISHSVVFPTSPRSKIFKGAQGYRSLRAHLEHLENTPAANLMRRLELETERHYEDRQVKGVNFIVSWIYGFFADYGLSPGRPLVWALSVWLIASAVVFCTDGGAYIEPDLEVRYFGWREILTRDDDVGRLVRSAILPIQTAFNPLGIFGTRLLVTASEWWTQAWLTFSGFFIDALLLMSIFGVRKRFKLN